MHRYRYFISYWSVYKGSSGFGNMERLTNVKISSIQDTKMIAKELKEELGVTGVTIINFILFEEVNLDES